MGHAKRVASRLQLAGHVGEPAVAVVVEQIRPAEIASAAVYWVGDESRPLSGSVVELEQYPMIGRNPAKL